jgi:hypothetical protein
MGKASRLRKQAVIEGSESPHRSTPLKSKGVLTTAEEMNKAMRELNLKRIPVRQRIRRGLS